MPETTRREHQAAWLQAIRRRPCSNTHLKDQGITTPAAIAGATGLPAAEAVRLLTRRQSSNKQLILLPILCANWKANSLVQAPLPSQRYATPTAFITNLRIVPKRTDSGQHAEQ